MLAKIPCIFNRNLLIVIGTGGGTTAGGKDFAMAIKDLWTKAGKWWSNQGGSVAIDGDGLIQNNRVEVVKGPVTEPKQGQTNDLLVKKAHSIAKRDNAEIFGEAFNRLIDKLQGINDHLDKQVTQHEQLMDRIQQLPELMETLPGAVENQKEVVDSLVEQLKVRALKDKQFAKTIERIPAETLKQTNAMADMNQKLSVAADIDAQMSDSFNRFNDTIGKLDEDTVSQTGSILQMSKAFASSDRYLKYIMARQNRRFMWVFIAAMAVCTIAIGAIIVSLVLVLNR